MLGAFTLSAQATEEAPRAILNRILEIRGTLHTAGALSPRALETIAALAQDWQCTVETGCGVSTLLLSQISREHWVFASERGNDSLSAVRRSPLLRAGAVRFVEGPTQATLIGAAFERPLDFALLDGPHAYPFPDLEYYFLYPHLRAGAILALDDIHIPTVHNLFRFLRGDEMFVLERVAGTTAFLRRTDRPGFDPLGDGWERQQFNRSPLLRFTWRERLRQTLKDALPGSARQAVKRWRRGTKLASRTAGIRVASPKNGEIVRAETSVNGSSDLPPGWHLWVLARRSDMDGWWPQGGGEAELSGGLWRIQAAFGEQDDAGSPFEICALAVRGEIHQSWLSWVERGRLTGNWPPVQLPEPQFVACEQFLSVRRGPR